MRFSTKSLPFFSSILLACSLALGGCTADTTEGDEASPIGASAQAVHGSSIGAQLVGDWQDSTNAYPEVSLAADGSYTLDTGIVCITQPCPSGESGAWGLYRQGNRYYVVLLSSTGDVRWYRVGFSGSTPTELTGAFGTEGTLVRAKKVYCVEWEAADEYGNSSQAFYAQNVGTYEEGKAVLAQIAPYFIHENIRSGTCASQTTACTKEYAPVCGQVFNDPENTYGNQCQLEVAIRAATEATGSAKGRWTLGECGATITPCATVKCAAGSVCEVHDGSAYCVSDGGQPCGTGTCAAGTVCCNSSCGICTPPGGVCIQVVCE